ncbi:MAG: efflux RND transporter periplasmic adaptor subunit [Clostridium sp.]|uniref:efflux RND transporter periplasmic adaptor subunit n=1 Tax=Clostridium sp. TaxID=1506 RepID=UPI0025D8E47F|nr:efflux RND transporter periplasmic adaptor subunit [Clostridium sp.]MCI6691000.1 efflux RND transporter periplasmic adaptor subunit [Clostridium sp.]MDY2631190.1 efflux RND transporter periplasmic adaptor subunit [Clostridium sp.]
MKKKKIIIVSSIFIVALGLTISGALYVKNKAKVVTNKENTVEYFTIEDTSGLKFKGSSIISNEQRIMLDPSKGEVNEVFVKDGQIVEKDTVLFNYYNEVIQEQVDELDRQINSLNSKIEKEKERESKAEALKKEAAAIASNNENPANSVSVDQLNSGSVIEELKTNLNDAISKRDSLKEKVVKPVVAEIRGKVYINKEDTTKEYMRVISEEPLIEAQASEFDVDELKVDSKVDIKIVSNNSKVTGKITKIDDIPTVSVDQKSSLYTFYVKPDEGIKIGFSVELTVNPGEIVVPKSSVIEESGKLYVMLAEGENNKKVEITATLKDDNYVVQNDSLKVGDKIMLNPSENSKEEV